MEFTTRQVKGHGRGKLLGFPTINMEIPLPFNLKEGIYACRVTLGNKTFMGALHYGPVPVFREKAKSLEVFLLDAKSEDIGDTSIIRVTPIKWLRDVQTFPTSIALAAQIKRDVARVRAALEEPTGQVER